MSRYDYTAPERRELIRLVGASVVLSAIAGPSRATGVSPAYGVLDEEQMDTLKALLSRLLPACAQGGGAVEAGAHVYIDRALGGAYSGQLAAYRIGLAGVTALARSQSGAGASGLHPHELDAIITRLEQGAVTERLQDVAGASIPLDDGGAGFFRLLRQHMLEGTFGDPSYGGNQNYLGWKLIGYSGIQLYYTPAEQAVDGPAPSRIQSMGDFGGRAKA
jgi:gluconate 2-dehydrogenase gamma chain